MLLREWPLGKENDDSNGGSAGNGNGAVEPGERIELTLYVRNDGTIPIQGGFFALDLRGLKCPLPVLRVRKALGAATAGSVLVVQCTDPMAAIDLPNLVRETGDLIERQPGEGRTLVFHIRKAA